MACIYFSVTVLSTEICYTKQGDFYWVMGGKRVINGLYRILTGVVLNSYRKFFKLDSTNIPVKKYDWHR